MYVLRSAPALFLRVGYKFYLGYPAWQRAGGLLWWEQRGVRTPQAAESSVWAYCHL